MERFIAAELIRSNPSLGGLESAAGIPAAIDNKVFEFRWL